MAGIWAVLSAIVFLYFLKKILSLNKRKKLPPGPSGLPILGHLHLLGKNPHHDLHRLARLHGPIMSMRFGLVPVIVISSPAAAELVLKTYDHILADRPHNQGAKYVVYDQTGPVFGRYGPSWRKTRKLCMVELLSQKRINQFHSMRRGEVSSLVTCLKQACEKHEIVDVRARVSSLTGDMICLMVFGKKYEDRDLDDNTFKDMVTEILEVTGAFNLADYIPFLSGLDLQGLTRRMKRVSKIFDKFLEKTIEEHAKDKIAEKKNPDFVDILMAMLESGETTNSAEFDRRHVKALLLDMIIVGLDTTSTATEWTLSELMKHPEIMKKLQNELEATVGLDHMVEESHLDRLPYLDCVIKEAMRLHPVGPLLPHEAMEDCEIDGFHVSKASRIMVNVWAIGRDPAVWVEPDKFLPERFMDSKIDLRGHDFELLPFGSGRRGCPGLQLGLLSLRLVVAQLVHCFDWGLPNGMLSSDLDMSEHYCLVSARENKLEAIPTYRLLI